MHFEMSSNLDNVLSCYNSSRARFELFIDEKVDCERFSSPGNPSPSLLSILTFTLLTCIIALALLFYWVFLPIRTQCWTSCLQPILKRFCPMELSFRLIIIIVIIISIIIKIITITIITIVIITIITIITIILITIIIIITSPLATALLFLLPARLCSFRSETILKLMLPLYST